MILDLIRHTTPAVEPGVCYGQTDLALSDSFENEAQIVLAKLDTHYDAVISSPLQRCLLLANKINANTRSNDERLLEYHFGDWEMKTWAEIQLLDSEQWFDDYVNQPAPNGDSLLNLQMRAMSFLSDTLQLDVERVAVVSHAGVLRVIHAYVLSTPLEDMFKLVLKFGAVIRVTFGEDGSATRFTSY